MVSLSNHSQQTLRQAQCERKIQTKFHIVLSKVVIMNELHLVEDYGGYAIELRRKGSVLLPHNLLFTIQELENINVIQSLLSEEKVENGDAGDTHDIYVRRIMTDKAGELPKQVNRPYSDQILEIIYSQRRKAILAFLFGSTTDYIIRRGQFNRMVTGAFVGLHLDVDSNPDYEFSVIIQLGRDFEGGEFVVYPDDEDEQVFSPTYGTVLITICKFRHEVRKVLRGERCALVLFYAKNDEINRREFIPNTN